MQRLEVNGAVRPIYGSLGVKQLTKNRNSFNFYVYTFIYKMEWPKIFNWMIKSISHNVNNS